MTDRHKRRKYFRTQKLIGLGLIILSMGAMAIGVLALNESEVGMLFLGVIGGLYLIFTKDMVLDLGYKLELDAKQKAQ
jgi:hypothetical protein